MNNIPELIGYSLIGSFLAYGIIRIASILFVSNDESPGVRLVASPMFGYIFVVSLVAIVVTKGKTLYVLPFFLLLFFFRKNILKYHRSGFELKWSEFYILIFNVVVHWIVFFDWKNLSYFSEWIDSYHYSSNVSSIIATNSECYMHECSNLKLKFDHQNSFYHYSEYYLTILIKFFFDKNSYFSLFFISIPVIMTIAQIQAISFLNIYSKFRGLNGIAFVLGITTCIRFINIGIIWPFDINNWNHFPIYQITNYFNIYFYNYNGKTPLFLSIFLTLYSLWKEDKLIYFSLSMMIVTLLNLVFLPFFVLFFFILFLIEKRPFGFFSFPLFLSVLGLLPIFFLNSGKDISINPMKPSLDFFVDFNIKNTLSSLRNAVIYVLGNFFPHFIFLSISMLSIWRSRNMRLFIIILILFPLLLNVPTGSKVLLILCVVSGVYFYLFNPGGSVPVFVSLFSILLLVLIFGIFDPNEYADFFQFYEQPIVGMAYALPFIFLVEWKISPVKPFSLIATIFIALNVYESHFANNRTYFRSENSEKFYQKFIQKTEGKKIRATFLTNEILEMVYISGDNTCGFDILNRSDSLEIYTLGSDNLTRTDSLRMARGMLAWKIYQRQPITIFEKKHPEIKNRDSLKLSFMKQYHITAFFRDENNPRYKMNYLNNHLSDSLYNPAETYWVYFLNFKQNKKN